MTSGGGNDLLEREPHHAEHLKKTILSILCGNSEGRTRGQLWRDIPFPVKFDVYQRALDVLEASEDIVVVHDAKNPDSLLDEIKIKKQKPFQSFCDFVARMLSLIQ